MLLKPGRLGTEEDAGDASSAAGFRVPSEEAALAWASKGVRASVIRLAPTVYGQGDHQGFIPIMISNAREKRVSAYVEDGLNRWPTVHRLDAAHLFRLALENGTAGARYHAVGEEDVRVRDIAQAIGRRLDVPVVSQSRQEAEGQFGWFAPILASDNPASSELTRERLQWKPVQPGLLADLEAGHYFM